MVDPKDPTSGPTFWLGYRVSDPYSIGGRGGHVHFPPKTALKIKINKEVP